VANVLPFPLRVKVIAHLVEGTSIRSTGRLVGVDKDAVMHLGVMIGLACLALHAKLVKGVRSALLEVDEVWAFCGRHQRRLLPTDPAEFGDHYTMFAIDPVSKLVAAFLTGARDGATALRFARDLRARVLGKPQVSVDGWPHWYEAFRKAFGWNGVDLGVVVKEYQNDTDARDPARKYSPGRVKSVQKRAALGTPREEDISTALAERMNLTSRMHQRRLTRLTNAYSKKAENLAAAVGLHFCWYNFVRVHETIGTTPAVAAGIADHPWSMAELVAAASTSQTARRSPQRPLLRPRRRAPSLRRSRRRRRGARWSRRRSPASTRRPPTTSSPLPSRGTTTPPRRCASPSRGGRARRSSCTSTRRRPPGHHDGRAFAFVFKCCRLSTQ
jgi:IS1 family transposase